MKKIKKAEDACARFNQGLFKEICSRDFKGVKKRFKTGALANVKAVIACGDPSRDFKGMMKKGGNNMKLVNLNNARLVWKSQADLDTVFFSERRTYCYKLPADASGVAMVAEGGKLLHQVDVLLDKPASTFVLHNGARCTFSRRFYAGQQVGAQLTIRDYPGPIVKAFSVSVVQEGK